MGFSFDVSVPVLTVFLQGLFSFFSPCVFPLIPLYIGYLSGGTGVRGEDGKIYYKRNKVMLHTLFFIIGVSFAFFLLGFGFSAMGTFFKKNQMLLAKIGGIIVFMFGLYQLGIFGISNVLGKERRLPFKLNTVAMSPVTALVMGFTFSFAWTPCVGPALASVLLMAASASTQMMGFLLIGVYTIGFVLPFLAVGLFTTSLLEFFKKHGNMVKYTVKLGGALMVVMGLMMYTGKMNAITGYLSQVQGTGQQSAASEENSNGDSPEGNDAENPAVAEAETKKQEPSDAEESSKESNPDMLPALDFTLKDQYGNTHTLEDYKGKTIFLNFWATWCPPCRAEMPDIQSIYDSYQKNGDDSVVILGVAGPNMGGEQSEEGIKKFLEDGGYTYPVLMDTTGELFAGYGIFSYPTTYMINKDGNVFGYVSGQISEDTMKSIIAQTIEGKMR